MSFTIYLRKILNSSEMRHFSLLISAPQSPKSDNRHLDRIPWMVLFCCEHEQHIFFLSETPSWHLMEAEKGGRISILDGANVNNLIQNSCFTFYCSSFIVAWNFLHDLVYVRFQIEFFSSPPPRRRLTESRVRFIRRYEKCLRETSELRIAFRLKWFRW